jgi:hypothetical protein
MDVVFPEDIVIAVLHSIKPGQTDRRITADREKLHTFFCTFSDRSERLRGLFRFRDKGFFPESEALDQALSNLEAGGLLTRQNAAPRYYFIQPSLDASFEQDIRPTLGRLGVDQAVLCEAATDLARLAA